MATRTQYNTPISGVKPVKMPQLISPRFTDDFVPDEWKDFWRKYIEPVNFIMLPPDGGDDYFIGMKPIGRFGTGNYKKILTTQSFEFKAGITYRVRVLGAGGAGGGTATLLNSTWIYSSKGGGGGGYAEKTFTPDTDTIMQITIGQGGKSSNPTASVAGGTTSVGNLVSATGGQGNGGVGGIGQGGDINFQGGQSSNGGGASSATDLGNGVGANGAGGAGIQGTSSGGLGAGGIFGNGYNNFGGAMFMDANSSNTEEKTHGLFCQRTDNSSAAPPGFRGTGTGQFAGGFLGNADPVNYHNGDVGVDNLEDYFPDFEVVDSEGNKQTTNLVKLYNLNVKYNRSLYWQPSASNSGWNTNGWGTENTYRTYYNCFGSGNLTPNGTSSCPTSWGGGVSSGGYMFFRQNPYMYMGIQGTLIRISSNYFMVFPGFGAAHLNSTTNMQNISQAQDVPTMAAKQIKNIWRSGYGAGGMGEITVANSGIVYLVCQAGTHGGGGQRKNDSTEIAVALLYNLGGGGLGGGGGGLAIANNAAGHCGSGGNGAVLIEW